MLLELHVNNFAVIESLAVRFRRGLNVLTGETGAGKSLIIDAVQLILGGRASQDLIRSGADRAHVSALFDLSERPDVQASLRELGYDDDEPTLLIAREISRDGAGVNRVNGRPATLSIIRSLTARLIDLHAQHEHQALFKPAAHRELLDAFGGEALSALQREVADRYARWRALERQLADLAGDQRERARMLDLYQYQIEEIDAANLDPDEEATLQAERTRLANAEKIREHLAQASALLLGSGDAVPSALDALGSARRHIMRVRSYDERFADLESLLETAEIHVQEANRLLASHLQEDAHDPQAIERIEARHRLLTDLKRKYGDTLTDVLAYRDRIAAERERLLSAEQRALEIERELAEARRELEQRAEALSALRREAATRLKTALEAELQALSMTATLEVSLEEAELSPHGRDAVQLLLAANAGEVPRPLQRVASGGELSRVMLALRSLLGRRAETPTLIFDEIDAGIGGRTATRVAEKLVQLARDHQILCVTHLPQVAAAADAHFVIEKAVMDGGRTVSTVRELTPDARETEIARMLSGSTDAPDLAHARVLLERARSLSRQTAPHPQKPA